MQHLFWSCGYRRARILIALASAVVCTVPLQADVFRGQVVDDLTDIPLEGAIVELRLTPDAETPDILVLADPFGFFETDEAVASTVYTATAKHPAYVDETITFTQDVPRKTEHFRMTPRVDLPGGPDANVFDLYFQIADTTSYVELVDFPIVARQYLSAVGGGSVRTEATASNGNGAAVIRGLTTGFYEFEVNAAGDPAHYAGSELLP